ncbi:MAG: adenylate/guanylate cyclase domain-containing protein [Bacteroidota bacterium]
MKNLLTTLTCTLRQASICCGFLLLGLSWPAASVQAQSLVDSLRQVLTQSDQDSQQVKLLNDIAWELKLEDAEEARSLLSRSAELARQIDYPKGEAQAYNNRGVVETIEGNYQQATEYYQRALDIRQSLNDLKGIASLHNNIGNILLEQNHYEAALKSFQQSLYTREQLKDTLRIARVSNNIALAYENLGDYPEALDYALTYLSYSERLELPDEVANAHNILGNIKREIEGQEEEAMYHYLQSIERYRELDYAYEIGQAYLNMGNVMGDLAEEHYKDKQFLEARGEFQKALDYYQQSLDIGRELEDSVAIADLYNSIGVLYKDQGSFYEELDLDDSAEICYEKAHGLLRQSLDMHQADDNRKGVMEVYNGIGDVYRRQKEYQKALDYTERYLDIARDIEDQKFVQSAYKDFARVYNKLEKYKTAYKYRKKYDELRYDRLNEQIVTQNTRREARYVDGRKQLEIEKKEKEIALRNAELKQAALWRNTLIGGTLGLLLLALLLYNRYRIKNRAAQILEEKNKIIEQERQRSEDLLLNILPADTARELKRHGQAPAKKYDSVTVLFTDFKDFTRIASSLPPEVLVAELDECFRAFDDITTRHGIEKIKTIGDSYMCASGLPQKSDDHPYRMVQAAIEMQQFMADLQIRQKQEGRPIFQSRIGIHTGPVVAGIVGSKKFAYDIWGDTVNLAARMESNGEVDRINISQSTYEEVKDAFECLYRGKIEVKNKGEIDMYFVQGANNREAPQSKAQKVYRY